MRDRDDDDWDEDDDRPRRRRTPKSRVYVHEGCGGATQVSGDDFVHICDPFWPCTGTYCCTCNDFVPLGSVYWADTEEPVDEFRRRMRQETPPLVQAWRFGLGFVAGAAIGGGIGFLIAVAAQARPDTVWIYPAVGAGVVGLVCYLVGTFVLNSVYDLDYRRRR